MREMIENMCRCPTADMFGLAAEALTSAEYSGIRRGQRWMYAPGDVPIALVAHIDTVHASTPTEICYDAERHVMWSPTGLGADDRAGVAGALAVVASGRRPHVILTDEEEVGARGAYECVEELGCPAVHLLVQLDRQGGADAVWYDCYNCKAERWIRRHGYTTARGTCSDISVLCPRWGVAGVNLSIGYYGQHTSGEYLRVDEWCWTVERVCDMIDAPPSRPFRYHARRRSHVARVEWLLACERGGR